MGNVGKGPAVHQSGLALNGLDQIGFESLLQQRGHGTDRPQIPGINRLFVIGICHQDPPNRSFKSA